MSTNVIIYIFVIYFCSIIKKNRMFADFYIPRLSNDMRIAVQNNNLGVKFGTEVWTLVKNDVIFIYFCETFSTIWHIFRPKNHYGI